MKPYLQRCFDIRYHEERNEGQLYLCIHANSTKNEGFNINYVTIMKWGNKYLNEKADTFPIIKTPHQYFYQLIECSDKT